MDGIYHPNINMLHLGGNGIGIEKP